MIKILVPTDFSTNSKSGVQFAIHWAAQQKAELIFIHAFYLLRPSRWSDAAFAEYADEQRQICAIKFKNFISGIYTKMGVKPGKHAYVIEPGMTADITIMDYCAQHQDINYICISTHGAGKLEKLFGTNTGNLITKSEVPVLAIPKSYKVTPITKVLYAADFQNYPAELKQVIDFAQPLKSAIEVLHFAWTDEITFDEKTIESAFAKKYKYGLQVHLEKNDATRSLNENLKLHIKKRKPSVVVMFTNQKRTFFQKIFYGSKAEDLSYTLKVPLLAFRK